MAAQSFPRPSSSQPIWNHDVFLSFRGKDTRKNFTDHLYEALVQAGINTFKDDDELPRGKKISSELLKAIEESKISIVVFSKGYAFSSWCLDELVKILKCKNNSKGQTVLPIFYDIDPSHVRHQTSTFADAFDRHEKRFNVERMQKWRAALTEVANLSGCDLQNVSNGNQAKFIQKVVEDVSIKVNYTYLNVAIHPIGIDSRVKVVEELLDVGASDVRFVGIYGMGGIGKTTIGKAVYNKIYYQFDGSCCLLNIKEISEQPNGLVHLQEKLLSSILKKEILNIDNSDRGINLIQQRLQHKRVLIVLDDVDNLEQLNSLARNCSWFGSGSRVIIITRDKSLLTKVGVQGKYEVEKLNHDESLQLFSWHAFKNSHPIEKYMKLSNDVVNYVGALPLALEVLGSDLLERSEEYWKRTLEKLQKIPHHQIQKILRISFDSLDDDIVKGIFLDIACFLIGMKKEYVMKILDGCGFFPYSGISILIQRSLVTINDNDEYLGMHDLIRDMGREIVRERSPNDLGKRSRLWFHEDVLNVLEKKMGSEEVEGLVLDLSNFENKNLKIEAFAKMKRLRLLQINDVNLSGCFEHLSQELRWLCWHKCPLKFLPSNLHLESLVVLDMQYSNVKQVWKEIKIINKLEVLDLSYSKYLTATPNFSEAPHLKRLILKGCTNLVEVHHSIGHLKKLVFLNLEECKNLRNLPSSICNLESLETLNLIGCSKLDMLPEQFGNMRALRELLADKTAIEQLPSTFGLLKNLKTLSLSRYKGQESKSWLSILSSWISPRSPKPISLVPTSFSGLCSLTKLRLSWCNLSNDVSSIDIGSLSSLKILNLEGNNFCSLPHSISRLPKLSSLLVNNCTSLQSISKLPESLTGLYASDCTSLQSISELPESLTRLYASDCTSLQSISELPESLTRLYASDCTSLERLSINSTQKNSAVFDLYNCHNLVEIQGLESMESTTAIYMDKCNNLAYNFRKSLLQGLSKSKLNDVILPGSEIPNWFNHQRIGSSISFHVPSLSEGQIIQEFLIWVAFANRYDKHREFGGLDMRIFNKTKGYQEIFKTSLRGLLPTTSEDHSIVRRIPLRSSKDHSYQFELESGEEIEVSLEVVKSRNDIIIKKCGIHVVVDPVNVMDNQESLIQYTSPSSYVNSDTTTEGKMGTLCAKRGRDNNKAGSSYDWSNEEKCPKKSKMELDAQEAKDLE